MHPKRSVLTLLLAVLSVCLCVSAPPRFVSAQTRLGIYVNCLYEGSRGIRAEDFPKLVDANFDVFPTQISPDALDTIDPTKPDKAVDAQFLEACKAAKVQALVIPNGLSLPQMQTLIARYPGLFFGYGLADDANGLKPAELVALYNAAKPFLGNVPPFITVAKGTKHADYGALFPGQLYHVQNYLGKAVFKGDGLKKYAYDEMLLAAAAAPNGLIGAAYPGKHITPYAFRRDPVFRAQEYAIPSTQEAVIWLQLIAGAKHILYYTAYEIGNANPLFESRLAERWDMLAAYKLINARVKELDSFLSGPGVIKGRSVVDNSVIGTWTKPSGETLTVTVDVTSELYPRTSFVTTKPTPAARATVKVVPAGVQITAPAGVEFATAP